MGGTAWVTLATNDSYSLGALVLANSLRKVATVHQLAVLITPAVSPPMREQLASVFDVVKVVDVLDSKDDANLALLKRPELGITFTKLHCWQLTQFDKGVFLDADTLVVRNCDELFDRDEFSAAPDVGWPDCFNSGVFVFRPSVETFTNLIQFAVEKGSFDGGDQGLLNQFFSSWATDDIRKHLPFVYNLTSVAVYSYIPAFKQYGAETRIVHFIGPVKPWLQPVDAASRTVTPTSDSQHLQPLLQQWWDLFIEKVHPGLSTTLDCASGMLPSFALPTCSPETLDCLARSDPPAPSFPEPYTPYIEKDDERQYNLPYQPFQVVSNDGELLNITFAEFARDNDLKESNAVAGSESEICEDAEPKKEEDSPPECHQVNAETPQEPEESREGAPEPEHVQEPPPAHESQFEYHKFFPDENVISAYLEHNIQEYQPYEHQHPHHHHAPEPEPEHQAWVEPTLPRFLTIPEDDQRQGHMVHVREPSPERHHHHHQQHHEKHQHWVPWQMPPAPPGEPAWHQEPEHHRAPSPPRHRSPSPAPESHAEPEQAALLRSKSMSNLVIDATDASSFQNLSHWKSQPEVNQAETPKKLPGLKPLVPKVKSPAKMDSMPKYTEFTEVNMVSEHLDPFGPPADTLGFVERAIMKRVQSRKGMFDVPQGALEPAPPPTPVTAPAQSIPLEMNEYVELSDCVRQAGNKGAKFGEVPHVLSERSSLRRAKRATRKVVEPWKPPETTASTFDVNAILKRLSALNTNFTPSPPAPVISAAATLSNGKSDVGDSPNFSRYRHYAAGRAEFAEQGFAAFASDRTETPAERLFGGYSPEQPTLFGKDTSATLFPSSGEQDYLVPPLAKKVPRRKSDKKSARKTGFQSKPSGNFGPVAGLEGEIIGSEREKAQVCVTHPFAALPGESLSEVSSFVPEIIVCLPTPGVDLPGTENLLSTPVTDLNRTFTVANNQNVARSTARLDFSCEKPLPCGEEQATYRNGSGVNEEASVEASPESEESFGAKSNDTIQVTLDRSSLAVEPPTNGANCPNIEDVISQIQMLSLTTPPKENGAPTDLPPQVTNRSKREAVPTTEMEADEAGESESGLKIAEIAFTNGQSLTEVLPSEEVDSAAPPQETEKETAEAVEAKKDEASIPKLADKRDESPKKVLKNLPSANGTVVDVAKSESEKIENQIEINRSVVNTEVAEPQELLNDTQPVDRQLVETMAETFETKTVYGAVKSQPPQSETVSEPLTIKKVFVDYIKSFQEESGSKEENGSVETPVPEPMGPEESQSIEISEAMLKFDLSQLVSDAEDDNFGSLETSTPSRIVNEPFFERFVAPKPIAGTSRSVDSSNVPWVAQSTMSYAAAAKREGVSSESIKEPTTVFFMAAPQQQNGTKPTRKSSGIRRKPKPRLPTTLPPLPTEPVSPQTPKFGKRKAEKPEAVAVQLPANRFQLLPEDSPMQLSNTKKKAKKLSKRFAAPSSSLPSPSSSQSETIVLDAEEDAQLALLEPDDSPGIAGAIAQLSLEPGKAGAAAGDGTAQAEYLRRQSWETGKMDYMGRDSFANVWSKISETLSQQPIAEAHQTSPAPSPSAESRPVTLAMILDSDSIETLPCDASASPGEAADDDFIFDRALNQVPPPELNASLPGILEEPEDDVNANIVLSHVISQELAPENVATAGAPSAVSSSAPPEETGDLVQPSSAVVSSAEPLEDLSSSAKIPPIEPTSLEISYNLPAVENSVVPPENNVESDKTACDSVSDSLAANYSSSLIATRSQQASEDANNSSVVDEYKVTSPLPEDESAPAVVPVTTVPQESSDYVAPPPIADETQVQDTSAFSEPSLTQSEVADASPTVPSTLVSPDTPPSPTIGSDSPSAFAAYKPPETGKDSEKGTKRTAPTQVRRQSSLEEGKEKRGVFTKLLEFVGVVKKKDEPETSSAVFYDDLPVPIAGPVAEGVAGIQEILKATDLAAIPDEAEKDVKKRSPSPRVDIPRIPHTQVIDATPPTSPGQKPPRRDPEALTVDTTIPETPPVVEKKTSFLIEPSEKPKIDHADVLSEIDAIIAKAKMIAEDQLGPKEPIYSNMVKKVVILEPPTPPVALSEEFEELRVTSEEERRRPKDKAPTSKLAGQILKAIPPPRRRAISDSRKPAGPSVDVSVEKPLDVVLDKPDISAPPTPPLSSPSQSAPHTPSSSSEASSASRQTPPPVPPRRRNRSKQRVDPQPPPKRKTK